MHKQCINAYGIISYTWNLTKPSKIANDIIFAKLLNCDSSQNRKNIITKHVTIDLDIINITDIYTINFIDQIIITGKEKTILTN